MMNQRFAALARNAVSRLALRATVTSMATRFNPVLIEQVRAPALRAFSTTSMNRDGAKVSNEYTKQIESYIKSEPVVMFIKGKDGGVSRHFSSSPAHFFVLKGTATKPRCGFSKAVVDIMTLHGAPFQTHNVLENEEFKQALKDFTSWPTIPQIFFKGEFIGGFDILLEMHKSGDLVDELKKIGIKSKLDDEDGDDGQQPTDSGKKN